MRSAYIEEQIQNLPDKPGVYIMKDENEKIIGSLTLYPIRISPKALQQAYFFVKF